MQKILVIRNDKIGDFMLAWPSFALIKQALPDAEIVALVPSYTRALSEACPYIDRTILDVGKRADKKSKAQLAATLAQEAFDASICFFSDSHNAQLVWKAGIPQRFAPATKLSQVLYNRRLRQRRSQSRKPEYEYNLDLARYFLGRQGVTELPQPSGPYFSFTRDHIKAQRDKLVSVLGLNSDTPWVFVHPGTGGSAGGVSTEQYVDLLSALKLEAEIVVTAGPGEEEKALSLVTQLQAAKISAVAYTQNDGLLDFCCSLACAALMMAGSTGPLHIAGALDVPTVGFYPAKRSSTPLRWRTINSEGRHQAFAAKTDQPEDLGSIDMTDVASQLRPWVQDLGLASTNPHT